MVEEIPGLDFEKPILELEKKIEELKSCAATEKMDFSEELRVLEAKCEVLKRETYSALTPWQRVLLARHPNRPHALDYIGLLFKDFLELHGDRSFGDDEALVGGLAFFEGRPVVVLGQQKGRSVQESMRRNFAMPHPEGYRKALRLMRFAEKFRRPVICLIDTPGAYPGIGAEERGQAQAIAENLKAMAGLKVPIVCVVIGEGGSGGALAIGVGDRLLVLENAWYSVISPEGCAAILFRDSSRAPEAAKALKLTAKDLLELGVADEVIPEPVGGAHRNPASTAGKIQEALRKNLSDLSALSAEELLERRYAKYRCLGAWREREVAKISKKKTKLKP